LCPPLRIIGSPLAMRPGRIARPAGGAGGAGTPASALEWPVSPAGSPPATGHLLARAGWCNSFLAGRGRSLLDARREDLEVFLGELLRCRALETVATGYRRLRVLCRWLEDEELAARRIREAWITGRRSVGQRGRVS
jgi:hypothetical protein